MDRWLPPKRGWVPADGEAVNKILENHGWPASKFKIQNLVKELKADDKYRDMLTWAESQGTDPVLVYSVITTWIKHIHNNRKKPLAREQKDKNEGNSPSVPPGINTDGHSPSIQPGTKIEGDPNLKPENQPTRSQTQSQDGAKYFVFLRIVEEDDLREFVVLEPNWSYDEMYDALRQKIEAELALRSLRSQLRRESVDFSIEIFNTTTRVPDGESLGRLFSNCFVDRTVPVKLNR